MGTPDRNLSTEHQRPGDAKRPSDTLDREQTPAPDTAGETGSETGGAAKPGDPAFATNGE